MNRENACFVSVNRSFQLQFTKRDREVDAHDWIEATDGTVRPTSSRETNVSINESDIPGKQGSLSLSLSFSIRISLCPGEIVITKGGKNREPIVPFAHWRTRFENGGGGAWATDCVPRGTQQSRGESERERLTFASIHVYGVESNEKLCNESDNEFSRRPNWN